MSAADGPFGGWAERIYLKPGTQLLRITEPLTADHVIAGGCGLFTGFADVVIEASGNPRAVPEGLELLREGGTYVIAGHYTDAGPALINPHVINRKHATVLGQWGTSFHHVTGALALLARHRDRLRLPRLIGGRYPLDRAGEALADVAALRVTKAVIQPNGVSGIHPATR
jgi:threonine dehydrogenase-like Zn-dependent dehydrogenase